MEKLLHKINGLLKNPKLEEISAIFEADGYIRLNRVYISPFSLRQLLIKLAGLGLVSWQMTANGLFFQFMTFSLKFYGSLNVVVKQKVFCIEIDFDPTIDGGVGIPVLKELEGYLKGCDALFFMTYFIDIDREILHHPLSESLEFLYKKSCVRK